MNGRGRSGTDAPAHFCVFLIRGYQRLVSPLFGSGKCRFYPSCSHYAVEAVELHGALRGLWLTVKRLVKCGPWHPGGYDPVPPGPEK